MATAMAMAHHLLSAHLRFHILHCCPTFKYILLRFLIFFLDLESRGLLLETREEERCIFWFCEMRSSGACLNYRPYYMKVICDSMLDLLRVSSCADCDVLAFVVCDSDLMCVQFFLGGESRITGRTR